MLGEEEIKEKWNCREIKKKKTQEKRVDNQREGKYQDLSQEKGDGM